MKTYRRRRHAIVLQVVLAAWWLLGLQNLYRAQQPSATELTYSKTLKGSVPEYTKITVDSTGAGSYEGRKLDEAANPRSLRLSPGTTHELFDLAAELNYFRSDKLESHKKVANLGQKTLTYRAGSEVNQVKFNYTQNRAAQDLADLFEKIASVEQHITALEYDIKYDHLSLPRQLLQIQIDLDNKALAEPELMVPILEKITQNSRFLHLAQTRAQNILQRIQSIN
jgi:hypothetical protein